LKRERQKERGEGVGAEFGVLSDGGLISSLRSSGGGAESQADEADVDALLCGWRRRRRRRWRRMW
jgi:hypothetical protein